MGEGKQLRSVCVGGGFVIGKFFQKLYIDIRGL
jgi:hypothetical protein